MKIKTHIIVNIALSILLGSVLFTVLIGSHVCMQPTVSFAVNDFSNAAKWEVQLTSDVADPTTVARVDWTETKRLHTTVGGTLADKAQAGLKTTSKIAIAELADITVLVQGRAAMEGILLEYEEHPYPAWTPYGIRFQRINDGTPRLWAWVNGVQTFLMADPVTDADVFEELRIMIVTNPSGWRITFYANGSYVGEAIWPISGATSFYVKVGSGAVVYNYLRTTDAIGGSEIRATDYTPVTEYYLTIQTSAGGNTDPAPATYGPYTSSQTQTVIAIPDSGYSFDHWELDSVDIGSANPNLVTMDSDHTLLAEFSAVTQSTLTILSPEGCGTNPPAGAHPYPTGTVVSVTTLTCTDYEFSHWIIDSVDMPTATQNPIDITMDTDHSIQPVSNYLEPAGWLVEQYALPANCYSVDVNPGGTTLLAGSVSSGRVYRSVDEGKTWAQVATLPFGQTWLMHYNPTYDCWFAAGDYYGTDAGMFRSTDDGSTWTKVWVPENFELPSNTMVHNTGMCEVGGDIYIGNYQANWEGAPTIFKSSDGGLTWTTLYSFGGEGHIHALRHNPSTGLMWCWIGDPGKSSYGLYYASSPFTIWYNSWSTSTVIGGRNMMSFEVYGNYIYFAEHDRTNYLGIVWRSDATNPNNLGALEEVWRGNFPLNNYVKRYGSFMLSSGHGYAGAGVRTIRLGGSADVGAAFGPNTWQDVHIDGSTDNDDFGLSEASDHVSLNGWAFVTNTLETQILRVKYGAGSIPQYNLTITTTIGGTTNPVPGVYGPYDEGTTVSVTAIPDANYYFDHWELDDLNVDSENPVGVIMDANHTLHAVFTTEPVIEYTLTITTTAGGTTNPVPGTYGPYTAGQQQSTTATPNSGYNFDHWELNGVNIGATNPYLVTMDSNHTLHAVFIPIELSPGFYIDDFHNSTKWTPHILGNGSITNRQPTTFQVDVSDTVQAEAGLVSGLQDLSECNLILRADANCRRMALSLKKTGTEGSFGGYGYHIERNNAYGYPTLVIWHNGVNVGGTPIADMVPINQPAELRIQITGGTVYYYYGPVGATTLIHSQVAYIEGQPTTDLYVYVTASNSLFGEILGGIGTFWSTGYVAPLTISITPDPAPIIYVGEHIDFTTTVSDGISSYTLNCTPLHACKRVETRTQQRVSYEENSK